MVWSLGFGRLDGRIGQTGCQIRIPRVGLPPGATPEPLFGLYFGLIAVLGGYLPESGQMDLRLGILAPGNRDSDPRIVKLGQF